MTSPVPVPIQGGAALALHTPLGLASILKGADSEGNGGGEDGSKRRKLLTLEAIRRLLLRVEAVRATSWLWVTGFPITGGSKQWRRHPRRSRRWCRS